MTLSIFVPVRVARALLISVLAIGLSLMAQGQSNSSIDPTFAIRAAIYPNALALDKDGRLLCAGGNFVETVNGHAQRGIVRFNSDGTLDSTFDAGSGLNVGNSISALYVQPDGQIIVVGTVTSYNAGSVKGAIRLFANGGIDPAYQVETSTAGTTALDPQGRLYVSTGRAITRLSNSGAVDPTFPAFTTDAEITSMDVDSDGKLLVILDSPQGSTDSNGAAIVHDTLTLQRFNSDGSTDQSHILTSVTYYTPATGYSAGTVHATKGGAFYVVASAPVAGGFTAFPITKYKSDFTIDPAFSAHLNGVVLLNKENDLVFLRDAIVARTYLSPPDAIVGFSRLGSDGSSSDVIQTTAGAAAVQSDGRVIIEGPGGVLRYDVNPPKSQPPKFLQPIPTDLYAVEGAYFPFLPVVTGDAPLGFQWFRGTTPVPFFSYPQLSDAGTYTLSVTNPYGTVTSSPITLHVEPTTPTIITQPSPQVVSPGGIASFTVFATGIGQLQYQWYKDGSSIVGATDPTYIVNPISADSVGTYRCLVRGNTGSAESVPVMLQLGTSSHLSNLSVRLNISSGQSVIAGFVTNAPKSLLLRAAGPALNAYGLAGFGDPKLEVFDRDSKSIGQNDNWDAALKPLFAQLGAFGFLDGSKDSAFTATLDGVNSAMGTGTGSGTLLIELYDRDDTTQQRLVNLSARSQVGTGADILIAGFVISGTGSKRLLIRGVGPTLAKYGVSGVLADPKLEVFDSTAAKVASNDNWDAAVATAFAQVGAFTLDAGSKDAALVVDLPVGIYSVQLSGVGGTTGQGLIEIYEIEPR
ncbi:MAG: Immunoglobulin I-set domain protein [Verrucomicrobia bacterium]|nr:Immunoglobulin I-set domain protein [Verrucomicrobiota bacterium]